MHDSDVVACPHCGQILHDRRNKERIKKELEFTFFFKGEGQSARLSDYSEGGVKMVYEGKPLEVDTVLDVEIKELDIRRPARTVWSKKLSNSSASTGLRLL